MNNKQVVYEQLLTQLQEYIDKYDIMNKKLSVTGLMSVLACLINDSFKQQLMFVGFYLVHEKNNYLEIGPYYSDILPTPIIQKGKGLCGSSWQQNQVRLENDVHKCNNYIACDNKTISEIVLPVVDKHNQVIAVLDIDSQLKNYFEEIDKKYLNIILNKLTTLLQ